MKLIDAFKKLSPGWRATILIGGGVTLLVGAVSTFGGDAKKESKTPVPSPGPGPTPAPPEAKQSYHITYRGVTATIGFLPDDNEWVSIYEINGEKAAIHARTNESGIIERTMKAIDAYYANVKWFAVDVTSPRKLVAGMLYRLSMPPDVQVALPLGSGNGRRVTFDALPIDWPAEDKNDPLRQRFELRPTSDFDLPAIERGRAWTMRLSQPSS